MVEQQKQTLQVSAVVQQVLGKLDVCLVDLLEQINAVINVLFVENQKLVAEFEQLKKSNSANIENQKHHRVV